MKQKPEDCAIMASLNPSRKFMFQVLWKNRAQLFQKESLPRDPGLDSTVDCIFLVRSVQAPPSPALGAGRPLCLERALSRPAPFPGRDRRPQIALRCSSRRMGTRTRGKRKFACSHKGKYSGPCVVRKPD